MLNLMTLLNCALRGIVSPFDRGRHVDLMMRKRCYTIRLIPTATHSHLQLLLSLASSRLPTSNYPRKHNAPMAANSQQTNARFSRLPFGRTAHFCDPALADKNKQKAFTPSFKPRHWCRLRPVYHPALA
jgi:hypothetical protein